MTTAETEVPLAGEVKKGMEDAHQGVAISSLVSAIPDFTNVDAGAVFGSFAIKDDLLIYHLYKTDRKKVYDEAQARMDSVGNGNPQFREQEQARISQEANEALHELPWWENFETTLYAVFEEAFPYSTLKVTYYLEVDSWSVILPEPKPPVPPTPERLAEPIKQLGARYV